MGIYKTAVCSVTLMATISAGSPLSAMKRDIPARDPSVGADSTPFFTAVIEEKNEDRPRYCYYRLNIEPEDGGTYENIGHAKRKWYDRFFKGIDYSFTSLMKIKVSLYEETVILYSRKYRSSRKEGENHDRTILNRGADYPVFLLSGDSNGFARVALSNEMKSAQSFNVAGSALESLSVALKSVAPSTDIVTKLTSDSAKTVAQKIDSGAGAFSSATGKNDEIFDINVANGDKIKLKIFGPEHEVNENTIDYSLGQWTIDFDAAFASYFYQDISCDKAKNPEDTAWGRKGDEINILSTKLVGNVGEIGSIGSYLKQLDWWSGSIVKMQSKRINSTEVSDFCRAIVGSVSGLGFNTVDSFLVADAVGRSSLVGKAEGAAMLGTDACKFDKRRQV